MDILLINVLTDVLTDVRKVVRTDVYRDVYTKSRNALDGLKARYHRCDSDAPTERFVAQI